MTTTGELDYSGTAGLNTDIGGVSIAENIPPANLNDAIRNMAAFRHDAITRRVNKAAGSYNPVKADHNQLWLCTGVATITLPAAIPADGWILWVKAAGSDCSISVSGGGTLTGSDPYTLLDGSTVQVIATNVSGGERYDIISSNASTVTGTFSPTIVGTTAGGSGTYSLQQGTYTKLGDRILFTINLVWSAHTGTGNMNIGNLPFTSSSTMLSAVSVYLSSLTFAAAVQGVIANSSTAITLTTVATGGLATALPMDTAASIYVSGHYPI